MQPIACFSAWAVEVARCRSLSRSALQWLSHVDLHGSIGSVVVCLIRPVHVHRWTQMETLVRVGGYDGGYPVL